MTTTFTAQIAATFENAPLGERLYEVVSPDGDRIASTTNELHAAVLADTLNKAAQSWALSVGSDAVLS